MNDVKRTLASFFDKDQVVEIRAIGVSRVGYKQPHVEAGYFDAEHRDELVQATAELEGMAKGIYVVMNRFDTALLSRAANRIATRIPTTADSDIHGRRWMLFDIDAGNPAGTSSSEYEHQAAIEMGMDIRKELLGLGWSDVAVADSGNGAHVYVPIDLPTDDRGLVRRCLLSASLRFDRDGPHIDTSVFNPSRITKFIGTVARKGDSLPDRPHRRSRWLHFPDRIEPVPEVLLRSFAAFAPDPKKAEPQPKGRFDLDLWLAEHDVSIRRGPVPYPNGDRGARKWVLESCPWNNHADSAAFLVQFGNGAIAAGCHHNSCQGFDWRDFRSSFEPGYDPSRTYSADSLGGTKPELAITNLADVIPKNVAWLWSGRIPLGKMTVVAGEPDLGKSFLTLDMATRVSDRGAKWPDGAPVPHGNVVIVTAEDDLEDTIRPRLNALGAVAANVDSIGLLVKEGEKDVALSLPDHLPQIEEAIIKRNIILLIIDPLLAFTGGKRVDSYKQSEVRPLLTRLSSLAQRTGCAVVCVMHLNKNEKLQNPLNRISDSVAFTATARSVLGVAEHPDDPNLRVLVSIKHNLSARPPDLAYQISGNRSDEVGTFEWSSEPVAINGRNIFTKKENMTKVRVADHFLDQILSQGSVESEILFEKAQHLEISMSALNRAKKNREGKPNEIQARRITTGNQGDGHWEWALKPKADPDW